MFSRRGISSNFANETMAGHEPLSIFECQAHTFELLPF